MKVLYYTMCKKQRKNNITSVFFLTKSNVEFIRILFDKNNSTHK